MIFLIVYSRKHGLLDMRAFAKNEMSSAQLARSESVRKYLTNLDDVEIALFETDSEDTLRSTHSRYFESIEQLKSDMCNAFERSA